MKPLQLCFSAKEKLEEEWGLGFRGVRQHSVQRLREKRKRPSTCIQLDLQQSPVFPRAPVCYEQRRLWLQRGGSENKPR